MYEQITDPQCIIEAGQKVWTVDTIHANGAIVQEFRFRSIAGASRFVETHGMEPWLSYRCCRVFGGGAKEAA